jgi:alcohol dehydrogenase
MIKEKIYNIIATLFNVDQKEISNDIGPGDFDTWDSLGQIQLISQIEKEFNLKLDVYDVMGINNIADIIQVVTKNSARIELQKDEVKPKIERINPSVHFPNKVFWGKNALANISNIKNKPIAFIVGGGVSNQKIKDKLNDILKDSKEFKIIEKLTGEPTEEGIKKIAKELIAFKPETVVTIGGGSTIDIAKLAMLFYENENNISIKDYLKPFSVPPLKKIKKFVAVPTTFGSGAEASSAAVFNNSENNNKSIILSHEFIPNEVILDYSLGEDLPENILYSCAFDALTHAIEGYVSIINNPLVKPLAIESIKIILEYISGQNKSLENLCYAAYYAGIVQNACSVGLTHSIAHQLSAYKVGHGLANAIFLAPVICFNAAADVNVYKELMQKLAIDSLDNFVMTIDAAVTKNLSSFSKNQIQEVIKNKDDIAELAMKDITFKTNPIKASKEDIVKILTDTLIKG